MKKPQQDPSMEAIRKVLEGPVIDVFRREIDDLSHLSRPAAYDAVMNDPARLDHCFKLFRSRPELFHETVVGPDRQPVTADDGRLSCGRTLAEGVALVVRASARRYFRARLDIRARARPPAKPALMTRLGSMLGLAAAAAPARRPPSRAETLYRAIRNYLRFDWQVLLIPHYAPLSPALVTQLGPRLLDIREAAELAALSSPGGGGGNGRPPLLLDEARRLMVPGRETIDAEILWRVVQQMDLARLFSDGDIGRVRRAVAQVATIHAEAVAALLPVLGDDIRRFAAFLMIAFTTLGEQRFKQDFCQEGQGKTARALARRLANLPPPPPCLEAMKVAYQAVLATAYAGGAEAGGGLLKSRPALAKALKALDGLEAPRPVPAAITG